MPTTRGVCFAVAWAAVLACGSSSTRPAESGGLHQTFEAADVGLYTGGSTGQEEDGAAGADGEGTLEPSCGEPGTVCGVSELADVNCGGAPRELHLPVPDANRGLAVRAGDVNDPAAPITASTRTDDQGRFAFELGAGTWCIVEEAKLDTASLAAAGATAGCLESWARTCDAVVQVTDQPTPTVRLSFDRFCGAGPGPCFPALPYP